MQENNRPEPLNRLPKAYEPSQYEVAIYELWEKNNAFTPQNRGGEGYFSLVAPPPNANANLHIGYGLTMAVEDIAARYNRLKGKATLFVPGADHAGFETWVVYEKKLNAEGKSRFDFSREELYRQVWDFVAANRAGFERQFRRLGASVDWGHFTFTLDDKVVKQAYATFKKMWDEGLVYRGERLVNFCTFHGTGFADIEVDYKEVDGHLWYIRYPLTDGSGEVVVATTRPETMLGDVAVAVHPDDDRYRQLKGKTVRLPLTNREIPVIADDMVDHGFGTGAVKITPAHDQNDYELADRHDLPLLSVIGHDGKMTAEAPEAYRGLPAEEARSKVVQDLEGQGHLVKTEDHRHSVGHCYKCGTVIQPLLREQWFVSTKPLAERAIAALKEDKITFYPPAKKQQLIGYFEGLRDWNISRQIAWGIPIPAFQNIDQPDEWIFSDRVTEETIDVDGKTYRRDPDVFDTWFSSSSWPYVTLDYPDSEDFKQFYPLSLMETGGEILYPWVSRMLMLGLYVTGEVPFKEVYIHGYVMAEDGSKMSKSLGNVIDLTDVIDKYGSDALRMGIIAGRTAAINRGYDSRRVEEARNFANKLWNVARFSQAQAVEGAVSPDNPTPETLADYWIIDRLKEATEQIDAALGGYRFAEAYEALYHFVWDDLADWYIEANKTRTSSSTLPYVLSATLKIAHPFAPFVTEAIWQQLWAEQGILAVQHWPQAVESNKTKAAEFEEIKGLVTEIRAMAAALGLKKAELLHDNVPFIEANSELISRLGRLGAIKAQEGRGLRLRNSKYPAWLNVDRRTAEGYLDKLRNRVEEKKTSIGLLEARLNSTDYTQKAPESLVAETRAQLEEEKIQLKSMNTELEVFEKASQDLAV